MVSKITSKEETFADQTYERFKSKNYNIDGFYNDNLIDELFIEIEAEKIGIDLTKCLNDK